MGSGLRSIAVSEADGSEQADAAACDQAFREQRWRAAVEHCTGAFQAAPTAALALRIAHAHWARGDADPAGTWAGRALELGTEDADAYVLVGHARRRAGQSEQALQAYRQYLRASPRGWHVRTVRAAIRQLRPPADLDQHTPTLEASGRLSVR